MFPEGSKGVYCNTRMGYIDDIRVILGLYWGYIGVILGLLFLLLLLLLLLLHLPVLLLLQSLQTEVVSDPACFGTGQVNYKAWVELGRPWVCIRMT